MEETKTRKEKKKDAKGFDMKRILFNLKAEFNKIIWPDRDSLIKRTIAVFASSVSLGVIIAVVDMIVKFGLGFLIS